MLRFRIGPIPVQIHPAHFLFSALMGWSSAGSGAPAVLVRQTLMWMGVVFISVLIHELGHASAALAFGYHPDVQLVLLGGLTRPNAPGPIPWVRDVLLTLAGPFAGLMLAVAAFLLRGQLAPSYLSTEVLETLLRANLFWSVVNLAPVAPLDGGHITVAVCRRFFGTKGEAVAYGLGALVAALLALAFYRLGSFTLLVLFAMLGFQTASMAAARWRTAGVPTGGGANPLTQARALLDAGRLDEVESLARSWSRHPAAAVRSEAERLLGWVAVKRGDGARALDHFARVEGRPVEAPAMAAALSLTGDDVRALPFWEQAQREAPNPTLQHEWAGALIRLGRVPEALSMPGVQAASAYLCAERVLYLRGDFLGSARLSEEALRTSPTPSAAYDAACSYARAGRPDDAVRLLQRAIDLGFQDAAFASTDEDLAAVRSRPEWETLIARMKDSAKR